MTEFIDHGVSGAKEGRPQLDAMLADVRRRKFDVVLVTKLDRLARSTHHLATLAKELQALGVDLVALDQAIDTTSASGRLLFHVLAAIAEFERDLIRDRVVAGIRRAGPGPALGPPRARSSWIPRSSPACGPAARRWGPWRAGSAANSHVTQVRLAPTKPGAAALRNPA